MTPLREVRKLEPGERLVVADGRATVERWWDYPAPAPDPIDRSDGEWAEILLEKLDESVRLRLMSDVPLGAMLSGGLDSSLIVALMARHMSEPVKTFAVGFAGEDSELGDARRVADWLGADHHELEVSTRSDADDLARLVWHLDEPLADLSSLGFLPLCELAREHVTVALTGQGADELFGGYRKHRVASLAETWERMPGSAALGRGGRAAPRPGPRGAPRGRASGRRPGHAPARVERAGARRTCAATCSAARWPSRRAPPRRCCGRRLADAPGAAPLEAALYLDARLGLVDDMLTYFDRASMACSLEVRVPFLDHELVELCARIPAGHKVRRLQGQARAAPGRARPRAGVRARQAQARLLQRGRGVVGGRRRRRARGPAAARSRSRLRGRARPRRGGAGGDGVARRAAPHANLLLALVMLELWLGEYLPRAMAGDRVRVAA